MNRRNHSAALIATIVAIAFCLPLFAANEQLPSNSRLQVRITERLSSETAKPGDTFGGTLAQPVVVNGKVLFAKGTDVKGQVVLVNRSGRLSSPGQLQLVLTSISSGWFQSYPVTVQPLIIGGGSHTKSNVGKIGGGAAAGAIVGGVAAGGKGAAIGAGIGAGTGTVVAAATGKREAVVEPETLLTWMTIDTRPVSSNGNETAQLNSYRDDREYRDGSQHSKHHGRGHDEDDEDDDGDRDHDRRGGDREDDYVFSAHDRSILRGCLGGEDYSNLPPGLAKRDRLPPGLEKQLQRNGTLPPGLQKRVQPLPERCEAQLPRLPRDWERVVLSGRIILLDQAQRILDILELTEDR